MCLVTDCEYRVVARGYCETHYRRFKKYGNPLGGGTFIRAPKRFIENLPNKGKGCITWPFSVRPNGNADYHGKSAARYVCEKFHGPPLTPSHEAAHSCGKGNEACVAPYHLSWKTHKENMDDRIVHGTLATGSRHGRSKLTEKQVREIRDLLPILPQKELGIRFGVSQNVISRIANNSLWRNCN